MGRGPLDLAGRKWFVVNTKPRKEGYAEWQLSRRGVVTFLPWIMEPAPASTGTSVAPMFPGYLFVHIDLEQQLWDVVWTPGVKRLVGFGETASPVDDSVIDFLRARAGKDGIVRAFPVFSPGERVRIRHGPLAGLVGIVEGPSTGRGRVRVLMELLRRQTRVEIPPEYLARAPD